jgi:hypothetical protein
MTELEQRVYTALDTAVENGYPLTEYPAEEIAVDLGTYDAQFEHTPAEVLTPIIVKWLAIRSQ